MPRMMGVLFRGTPAASIVSAGFTAPTVPSALTAPAVHSVPGHRHAPWAPSLPKAISSRLKAISSGLKALTFLGITLTALGMLGGCEGKDSTGSAPADSAARTPTVHSAGGPPAGETPAGISGEPATAMGDKAAPRILMFGDSLTAGFGLPLEMSMPSLLQKRLALEGYPHKVINAGVSGDTTAGGVSRLNWVLREPVAVLVLALGANDGLRGLDPDLIRANLAQIIEATQGREITVVLAGMKMPANYGQDYTTRFEAVFPQLARKYDLPFLPFLLEGVAMRPHLNQADGIHPNIAGTKAVAENVWAVLQPLLEK